jgi:hypothetical protein
MSLNLLFQNSIALAGRVNRKNGSDAIVDMSEIKNGDSVSVFIIQVTALS